LIIIPDAVPGLTLAMAAGQVTTAVALAGLGPGVAVCVQVSVA
jgi:hypothetical protein